MMNKQPFLSKLLLTSMKNRVFMTALTADDLFYYSALFAAHADVQQPFRFSPCTTKKAGKHICLLTFLYLPE